MVTDQVLVGVGIRIITGTVIRGQQRRRRQRQDARNAQPG